MSGQPKTCTRCGELEHPGRKCDWTCGFSPPSTSYTNAGTSYTNTGPSVQLEDDYSRFTYFCDTPSYVGSGSAVPPPRSPHPLLIQTFQYDVDDADIPSKGGCYSQGCQRFSCETCTETRSYWEFCSIVTCKHYEGEPNVRIKDAKTKSNGEIICDHCSETLDTRCIYVNKPNYTCSLVSFIDSHLGDTSKKCAAWDFRSKCGDKNSFMIAIPQGTVNNRYILLSIIKYGSNYTYINEELDLNHLKTIVENCFIDCGPEYAKPYVFSTINSVTNAISKAYNQTDDKFKPLIEQLSNYVIDSNLLRDPVLDHQIKIQHQHDKIQAIKANLEILGLNKSSILITELDILSKLKQEVIDIEPLWKDRTKGYWQFLYHRSHHTTYRPPASQLASLDKPATLAQWTWGSARFGIE